MPLIFTSAHGSTRRREWSKKIRIENTGAEDQMIDTFEKLRESVDSVPAAMVAEVERMRSDVGTEKYEELLIGAVQNIGRGTLRKDATEFFESLKLALQSTS